MKKVIFLIGLAAALYFFAWPRIQTKMSPPYSVFARQRAEAVLQGMQGTSDPKLGTPEQYALSQWAENKIMVDRFSMEHYANLWDQFRQKKNIYRTIQSYEILDVTDVSSGDESVAIVRLRIDGQPLKWIVKKGVPIAWGD